MTNPKTLSPRASRGTPESLGTCERPSWLWADQGVCGEVSGRDKWFGVINFRHRRVPEH